MRRLAIVSALTLLALVLGAARPATADAPPLTTALLPVDAPLAPGAHVTLLTLELPPGPYLITGQALVGAADSGTTCTAAIETAYAGATYAQVSTHQGGELAPLPLAFAPTLLSTERVRLSVACTAASKAKRFPNTLLPDFQETGATQPRAATWLIAVPLP